MKRKRWIWTQGTVILPLDLGKQARYVQNGILKVTDSIIRIMEQTDDHVMFETRKFCYYIATANLRAEECALCMAA